jgi:hypothetical protein
MRAIARLLGGRPKHTKRIPAGATGGMAVLIGVLALALIGGATHACSTAPTDAPAAPAARPTTAPAAAPPQRALEPSRDEAPPPPPPRRAKRGRRANSGGTSSTPKSSCCKVCSNSQPCGNSCIPFGRTCRKGTGCAC